MKTYYDLIKKEKKNYKKEFRATPFGEKLNNVYLAIVFLVSLETFFFGYSIIMSAITDNDAWVMFNDLSGILLLIVIIIIYIFKCYESINFSAWLKNKHKIKRW